MAQGFLGRAAALGASYMLGAFNDNFFKQSALLLAVAMQQSQYRREIGRASCRERV